MQPYSSSVIASVSAFAAIMLAGCTLGVQLPSQPPRTPTSDASSIELTVVGTIPPTFTPIVTDTPVASATPAPFVPFTVTTWADNVVLRQYPGHLFAKLGILPDESPLTVMGRAAGGEWLLVSTSDNRNGWVFTQLVETGERDMSAVPIFSPPDILIVRGRVTDDNGMPVSGIQFAIVQGSAPDAPRTDAMTDETGVFHAFMPNTSTGHWWVGYTAIACTSNIMDKDCNWAGGPSPTGAYVQMPQDAGTMLEFSWR